MRLDRLLLASAACALVAGTVSAQTTTTTTSTQVRSGANSTGASQPGAYNSTGAQTGAYNSTGASQPGSYNSTEASQSGSYNSTGASQPGSHNSTGASQTGSSNATGMSGASQGANATGASASGAFTQITPAPGADIVSVLKASGQFTTLLKAVAATNLTSVLQRPGTLTVFAPTDAAFAALPAAQLATLMQPANVSQLQQLVLLHVVNTPIKSSELVGHTAINEPTVATGKSIHLDGTSGTVKVDDATVLQPDVKASNGTIFVIDKVLSPTYVPPAATASTTTSTTSQTAVSSKRSRR